jgi:hypothetical protein
MALRPPVGEALRQRFGRKMLIRLNGTQQTEPFRWFQDAKELGLGSETSQSDANNDPSAYLAK